MDIENPKFKLSCTFDLITCSRDLTTIILIFLIITTIFYIILFSLINNYTDRFLPHLIEII